MTSKPCTTCAGCEISADGNLAFSHCNWVRHPVDNTPMPVLDARRDTWNGYTMPCGFAGAKWVEKAA